MRRICLFVLCVVMMCGVSLTAVDADEDEPPSIEESSQGVESTGIPLWGGVEFRPTTSRTIMRRTQEMTDFSWSPVAPVHNWAGGHDGEPFYDFSPDKVYRGILFTVETKKGPNPDLKYTYDWPSFHATISNTPGGLQAYGNSAFGFTSIALGLPRLYTWQSFLCDATQKDSGCDWYGPTDDDNMHSLSPTGSARRARLQVGDILLFTAYPNWGRTKIVEKYTGSGVRVSEQVPGRAQNEQPYNWEDLLQFMPARRNRILDWSYVPKGSWTDVGFQYGSWSDISVNQSGVYVVDSKRVLQYSLTGNLLWYYELYYPTSVVASSFTVYVADASWGSGIPKVVGFSNGYPSFEIRGFCSPQDLGLDADENLYVLDSCYGDTYVWNFSTPAGTSWYTGLTNAYSFTVSRDGFVYVVGVDDKIYKYDLNGNFQFSFGGPINTPGKYNFLTSVATDSLGYVYVGDWTGVQKYDGGGNLISYIQTAWQVHRLSDVGPSRNIYVLHYPRTVATISQAPTFIEGPTNLHYTNAPGKPGKIQLNWQTNSTRELGFVIMRKEGVNGDYKILSKVGPGITTFVDAPPGGVECFYRVYAYATNFASTYSNEVRVETAIMEFLSPTTGTIIPSGSTFTIKWDTVTSAERLTYMLDYSSDGGATWNELATYLEQTTYDWSVPVPKANQPNCLIKIKAFDLERGRVIGVATSPKFVIEVVRVTSPTKGQVLKAGQTFNLTWQTNATVRPVATVDIVHFINNIVYWSSKGLPGNPGQCPFTAPKASANCKIRVILRDSARRNIGQDDSPLFTVKK